MVTSHDYRFITRNEYSGSETTSPVELDNLLEPVGCKTAPAIAAAAISIRGRYGERAVMLILPADHSIQDTKNFLFAVSAATALAAAGHLVTFGIRLSFPETGFGYPEAAGSLEPEGHCLCRLIEKSSREIGKFYPYATTH